MFINNDERIALAYLVGCNIAQLKKGLEMINKCNADGLVIQSTEKVEKEIKKQEKLFKKLGGINIHV